jgi:hypothetical protein
LLLPIVDKLVHFDAAKASQPQEALGIHRQQSVAPAEENDRCVQKLLLMNEAHPEKQRSYVACTRLIHPTATDSLVYGSNDFRMI